MADGFTRKVLGRAWKDTDVFSLSNYYRVGGLVAAPFVGMGLGFIHTVWWQIALGGVTGWIVLVAIHFVGNWICAPGRLLAECEDALAGACSAMDIRADIRGTREAIAELMKEGEKLRSEAFASDSQETKDKVADWKLRCERLLEERLDSSFVALYNSDLGLAVPSLWRYSKGRDYSGVEQRTRRLLEILNKIG